MGVLQGDEVPPIQLTEHGASLGADQHAAEIVPAPELRTSDHGVAVEYTLGHCAQIERGCTETSTLGPSHVPGWVPGKPDDRLVQRLAFRRSDRNPVPAGPGSPNRFEADTRGLVHHHCG